MSSLITSSVLLSTNLVWLACLFVYLATKIKHHPSVILLQASLIPLFIFQLGSHRFVESADSLGGAKLIVLGIILTTVTFLPLSLRLGRQCPAAHRPLWMAFYAVQIPIMVFLIYATLTGRIVEWVTGILEQPIMIIDKHWRYYFFYVIGSNILPLLNLDKTLQHANEAQREKLKFVFIAFLGFTVYFSYLSANILLSSYVSLSMLQSGAAIIFCGLGVLTYSFFRYPAWEVKLSISRNLVFGVLSATTILFYLILSGTALELLRFTSPGSFHTLLPVIAFAFLAFFLIFYLSPYFRSLMRNFVTMNVFRNKYDYRDLWMKFSDKSSGSLDLHEVLPKVAEFVADAMFVRQVAIWLRSPNSETFCLAYCHDPVSASSQSILRFDPSRKSDKSTVLFKVPDSGNALVVEPFPIDKVDHLEQLGISRIALVEKNNSPLALLGIGREIRGENSSAEDDQLFTSISNQLGNLILTHKLSEDLLLSREWDSFNRFASFVLHDLKNLATLQGMTLENAKHFRHNPKFVEDAFATFHQTTDKMINLIAGLSVQRGQFSLKQQPVNILEIISNTFVDLKITERNGVKLSTTFPPENKVPIISGDPELLQKAFTNLLLNAIQSLPRGEGAVNISVSQAKGRTITAAIRDNGCGISPEQMRNLFRPFQTTKVKGMGIGLCHTRSIIEVHGGQIRIESQVNAGTKVEVELPTI